MIILDQLKTGYKSKTSTKILSQNLNAVLPQGQLTCLIGDNGVGKSTLLRTIAGFISPLQGNVFIDKRQHLSIKELSKTISVVLTEHIVCQTLKVRQLVEMGRHPHTSFGGRITSIDNEIVNKALQLTGIEQLSQHIISTLSDGERQKVMIAKAIVQQTPYILLDEPTSFLDFKTKPIIMNLLRLLCHKENKSILFSTHDLDLALTMVDYVWLLTRNKLIQGTPSELAENGCIEKYFNSTYAQFNKETLQFSFNKL